MSVAFRRMLLTVVSFWASGIAALAIMADPGTLTCHILFVVGPLLSTVGLFVGPRTFVIGVNGIIYGYGSGPLLGYGSHSRMSATLPCSLGRFVLSIGLYVSCA